MGALHLTKTMRAQVAVIREVLAPWGLGSAILNEGPHMVVKVFARDGGGYRLSIVCTPKSREAAVNKARQRAKALVRLINARAGY